MPVKTNPLAITQALSEYGIALVLISFVLLLLFIYFWKMINQKSLFERMFDAQNHMLEQMAVKLQEVKEELIKIKTIVNGNFRNKGWDDE